MDNLLTLGSLFDGSGGFPLGAVFSGILPLWASEVAPFAIRVTTKRLPWMRHLGDIHGINGAEIEPVDIITFGSPCTDMSVAGKRAGLEGKQSVLFYEAIRIIREMRNATHGKYPRFIIWENVPGAFSSNKGEDFRAVLTAIVQTAEPEAEVPAPDKKGWPTADVLLGNGWSVAYRIIDAQYFGVAQRRRRIYLVADFGGRSASKILFESEGLSGYSAESFRAWQESAEGVRASSALSSIYCLNDQGGERMDVTEDMTATLRARSNHPPLVFENHSQDTRFKGPLETAQTVLATYGTGGNDQPFVVEDAKTYDVRFTSEGTINSRANVYEADTSRTIDTSGNAPDSNQGGIAVVAPFKGQ